MGAVREGGASVFRRSVTIMVGLIVFLLVLWVVLSIVGFTIKGLFWLAIIAIILFVVTGVFGFLRRGSKS